MPPKADYCGECGQPLPEVRGQTADESNGAATGQPPPASQIDNAAPGPGGMPPAGNPPPGQYPYAYPMGYPAPVARPGGNTGLIVGLVAAALAAVGAIVAVFLLASGGSGSAPAVSTASNAAAVSPPSVSNGATANQGASHSIGSGATSGPAPTPSSSAKPSSSQPDSASSAPSSGSGSQADAQDARAVVERHWDLINRGDFEGAFALLAPGYMDHDSWIASHEREAPITASVSLGSSTFSSPTSANVPIVSLHTRASDGCANWTGSYDVKKQNGSWLISQANLSQQSC